ncbi:MAG: hypothetical protein J3K34DRAFT_7775 [Monoraphidium minutum]|nr:MAG: hypothetical protein J3K34DRAFT_7775 [Monoraphidium minutum]
MLIVRCAGWRRMPGGWPPPAGARPAPACARRHGWACWGARTQRFCLQSLLRTRRPHHVAAPPTRGAGGRRCRAPRARRAGTRRPYSPLRRTRRPPPAPPALQARRDSFSCANSNQTLRHRLPPVSTPEACPKHTWALIAQRRGAAAAPPSPQGAAPARRRPGRTESALRAPLPRGAPHAPAAGRTPSLAFWLNRF